MSKRKFSQYEFCNSKPKLSAIGKEPLPDSEPKDENEKTVNAELGATVSPLFGKPFWTQFYDLECELNRELRTLRPPPSITHVYNPVEYAADLHCDYLRSFLKGPKKLIFVGMNPGPNGMGQTGIPFGNIKTVRNFMQLSGSVQQPPKIHAKRPVNGMQCTIEEPSGVRLWTLLKDLAGGSLLNFSEQCFVHNFCPLAFFDKDGKNITPSELKGEHKIQIRDICLRTLDRLLELLQPEIVVSVGRYIHDCLKKSVHWSNIKVINMPHPSPRALNNQNWPKKAEQMLSDNGLLKYIRNEH